MLTVAALSIAKHSRRLPAEALIVIFLQIVCYSPSAFGQSLQPDASPQSARVALADSVAAVPAAVNPSSPAAVIRTDLTQSESETRMEFSVALKMRDFSALKERIARNEVISPAEMAAKYFPTNADYTRVPYRRRRRFSREWSI